MNSNGVFVICNDVHTIEIIQKWFIQDFTYLKFIGYTSMSVNQIKIMTISLLTSNVRVVFFSKNSSIT